MNINAICCIIIAEISKSINTALMMILVEKRRRYKINDCISELATLLPPSYDLYVLIFTNHCIICNLVEI